MLNPDTPTNSIADEEIQEQLKQPFITKNIACDAAREDGNSMKSECNFFTTKKSILRVIFWTLFSLLLMVQFRVGLQHSSSSDNLHHYTVNWCIGLWVIASRLFLKTVADGSSVLVNTIPELITCVLVIMVAVGWLECAFLVMVLSITVLSLHVVAQSLYTLANSSPDTDTITESSN